jgi:lipoate-protein ligase B
VTYPAQLLDLGLLDYRDCYARQVELVAARQQGAIIDTLVLVEHPHVITVGRAQKAMTNVLSAAEVPVVQVERGGDATYHGPGQLVAYPIVLLRDGEKDLHRFLRNLEEAMILTLAEYGITGERIAGKTGVWIGDEKAGSIGIACRKWVTFHGLALNVTTDLEQFARINPCGFDARIMTSISRLAGRPVSVDDAKPRLARHLAASLDRALSN